jgi:hypothetical protein
MDVRHLSPSLYGVLTLGKPPKALIEKLMEHTLSLQKDLKAQHCRMLLHALRKYGVKGVCVCV